MSWGSRFVGTVAVACCLAGIAGVSGCGNDGKLSVRPAPNATAVASPTVPNQPQE